MELDDNILICACHEKYEKWIFKFPYIIISSPQFSHNNEEVNGKKPTIMEVYFIC